MSDSFWLTPDGKFAVDDDGLIVCDSCPCVSSCPYPEIQMTVTWNDTDSTKTFFGETFTNGQTIQICPDLYKCRPRYTQSTTTYSNPPYKSGRKSKRSLQQWNKGGIDLVASYDYGIPFSSTGAGRNYGDKQTINILSMSLNTGNFNADWYKFSYYNFGGLIVSSTTANFGSTTYSDINVSTFPLSEDNIADEQFGSVSDGNVTLTWARGQGDWNCTP